MHQLEEKVIALEQEFRECRENIGEKVVRLELGNAEKLTRLETQLLSISLSLTTFVNHHQFAPVKLIAYGLAGGVLTTVLGAVLAKVLVQ